MDPDHLQTPDRTCPASIGVQLLDDSFIRAIANQLKVSTAAGQATTATVPTNDTQQLRVRPGPTKWLRITITGASNVIPGDPGAGIREVLIPGVRVTRYLKTAAGQRGRVGLGGGVLVLRSRPGPGGRFRPRGDHAVRAYLHP